MSVIRQNFHPECEDALNRQINVELYASYVYLSMVNTVRRVVLIAARADHAVSYYFDRQDVALPGLSSYFKKASDNEREHAMKFLTYQNKRGGKPVFQDIRKPEKNEWGTSKDAMNEALNLEKLVNEDLLKLHALASTHNDPNFVDFIETEYLQEQVDSMKEIGDHVTNLERVGEGLGVFIFDKQLQHSD